MVGLQSEIPKLKEGSDAFYSHVDFGVKWLQRFDSADIPLISAAVLRKVGRQRDGTDGNSFCLATVMSNGFAAARKTL